VRTAAIVLAGGAASRFGGDKLAADYEGRPVLHHALTSAAAVADPVLLVLAPDAPVPELPVGLDAALRIARDAQAYQGPLAGLAGGLAALPVGVDRAIVVAGDMPALVPAVLLALLDAVAADTGPAVACLEADPASPLPMAVRPSLAGPAATALLQADRRSLRALLDSVPSVTLAAAAWRRLDPDGATLRDIDTPGDLSGR
jgi:molybdopterin-guanine dinucleotide biosynthesis protein A